MIRISKATWTMTVVIGAAIQSAAAAPKAPDGDPEWYLRKESWQDTMRVSREALVRHLAKEADATVPGSPSSVRFTPWQAIGPFPRPAGSDGWDHAYPPEQEIAPSKRYGALSWKRETRPDGRWHSDINLPTESQWEFACRGGTPSNQAGNGRAWGLDRMPGDVAEWTRSTYQPYPYAENDGRNNGASQGRKVVRGATAISLPNDRRDTYRLSYQWWQPVWNVGFRVVCLDEEPTVAKTTATR